MGPAVVRISADDLAPLLPHPAADANKYTRGTLVFVGGSEAFPGAAFLACAAAQRMGAGYVEAFCHPDTVRVLRALRPSLVARAWDALDAQRLQQREGHPAACVAGCGMVGGDADQMRRVRELLETCDVPLIVDGGALSALAEKAAQRLCAARVERGLPLVLTPHAGEAARLAAAASLRPVDQGCAEGELASFARDLARAYGATVLLKGPRSFIASPSTDEVRLMDQGTPALAKAGTGDVLAGMVGALAAQRVAPVQACMLAATLHAGAARCAEMRLGDISVCAEDVLESLPEAIRYL